MKTDHEKLLALKEAAMARKRTVLFDNDGGDVASLSPGTSDEELLGTRTAPALEAGIDTYIYTTGWGFGIGLHDSKVGSVLRNTDGHLSKNKTGDFIREGTDCLRITAEYVRSRGVELFWGMRMNDTHDAGYGNVFLPENEFKKAHPEVLFGPGIEHGAVTAVDYLDPRVREFGVAYIMDVIDRYPIDGIFLDFFRHPLFFRSNAHGDPATNEEIEALTAFMTEVTEELSRRRRERGIYYLVLIRVPDSIEYCRAIGIDIERWLSSGFVDILSTTSYLHFNEWAYSAELGHRYGVPVYPSLDESRVQSEFPRHKRNCLAGYYGRIMNVWSSDCDGVFMFNNSGLRDVHRNYEQNWFARDAGNYQQALEATVRGREYVSRLTKTYFASVRGVGAVAGGALPHEAYINIPTLNHLAPVEIIAGGEARVPISVFDDPPASGTEEATGTAELHVFVLGDPDSITVSVNDTEVPFDWKVNEYADQDVEEHTLVAQLPWSTLRAGANQVTLSSEQAATILDLWIDIEYDEDS